MKPLISIVTPSYNQGEFIEKTILSVINQKYKNKEYIIIDGASNDNSVEIIKKYKEQLTYWISEKDKGQSDAINKGWKIAKGDILAYLNSDDILEDGALEKVSNYFRKHPDIGIIYGDCNSIEASGKSLGLFKAYPVNFKKLLKHGQRGIFQPSAFFNADVLRRVGYLNKKWHLSMDYDLILKVAKISKLVFIPETLASYRIHSNTKSFSLADKHWKETFKVRGQYSNGYPFFMKWNYLKFRILKFLPGPLENFLRKKRNAPVDKIVLMSKKDKSTNI